MVTSLKTLLSRSVIKSQSGPISMQNMLYALQLLGKGFAPGPHWGTSSPRPSTGPQLAKPARRLYAPIGTCGSAYTRIKPRMKRFQKKTRKRVSSHPIFKGAQS